ncbi:MAG TPA: glycerol-3-phosphate 1-O-acyltransferase PlsY [Thermoanaerobaculia bacterium]|nr:glycerol-3-phosphate 1-O-acyltransferase PlsY [Thermoanaerobaculia bacterium]
MLPLLLVVASYLIGSIPFSYLVVRLMTGKDIREHGSRNVGATNVARSFGKAPGIIALFLDGAKGYAVVVLAEVLTRRPAWPLAAGSDAAPWHSVAFWIAFAALVAVIGHMFPVWLRFHGGKGVATATGAFLALDPIAVAASLIIFFIVLLTMRFVSLASIVSAASFPVFLRFLSKAPFWTTVVSIVISILIIVKHHSNIARIAQGTERRIGDPKERS